MACTVEKKLYGGRGLGLVREPQMGVEVLQIGGLLWENEEVRFGDDSGSGRVSDRVARKAPESFRELPGTQKWSKGNQNWTNSSSRETRSNPKVG